MESNPRIQNLRKRRPPVACSECRRRKIRCSGNSPCAQCEKSRLKCNPQHKPRSRGSSHDPLSTPRTRASSVRSLGIIGNRGYDGQTLSPAPSPCLVTPIAQTTEISGYSIGNLQEQTDFLHHFCGTTVIDHFEDPLSDVPVAHTREVIKGQNESIRFWGRSHFSTSFSSISQLRTFLKCGNTSPNTLLEKKDPTKNMTESVLHLTDADAQTREMQNFVLHKPTMDVLVDLYFRNFETFYRILHIPTFCRVYEETMLDISKAKGSVLAMILTVSSIGASFHSEKLPSGQCAATTSKKWISLVETWLACYERKDKLDLSFIQIACLLVISRQVNSLQGEISWLNTGSLLRSAMAAGLHRDPSTMTRCPLFIAELRRRLWFTVAELDLQASIELGMPSMITPELYDCKRPANLDDNLLHQDMITLPSTPLKPTSTRTWFQISLTKSQPERFAISRMINLLGVDTPYEEHLKTHRKLVHLLEEESAALSQLSLNGFSPSPFQEAAFKLLSWRWLAALHQPFSNKAYHDPRYNYSRSICVEVASAVYESLLSVPTDQQNPSLLEFGGGMFRYDITQTVLSLGRQSFSDRTGQDHCPFLSVTTSLQRSPAPNYITAVEEIVSRVRNSSSRWADLTATYLFLSMITGLVKAGSLEWNVVELSMRQELARAWSDCQRNNTDNADRHLSPLLDGLNTTALDAGISAIYNDHLDFFDFHFFEDLLSFS